MEDGWKSDLAVTFEDGKCTGIYAADKRTYQMIDITEKVRELLFPNGSIEASEE